MARSHYKREVQYNTQHNTIYWGAVVLGYFGALQQEGNKVIKFKTIKSYFKDKSSILDHDFSLKFTFL